MAATVAIASSALADGRPEQAIREFRRAQALLGMQHLYGPLDEDRAAWFEAASLRIHRGLAEAYLETDEPYAAAVEAGLGVNLNDTDPVLWTLLGRARYRLADIEEADAAFERAALLGAGDADLHWGRARVAMARNRLQEAISEVRAARSLRGDPRFALALGRWAALAGDYPAAVASLEDFLALAPGDPRAVGTRNLAHFFREVARAPANVVEPRVTRLQVGFDLKPGDEIPYLPVRIAGHPEAYVLLDTGAEQNVIDRTYAELIGSGPILPGGRLHGVWQDSPGGYVIVDSLTLGSLTVVRVPFAVADFEDLHLRSQGDYYIAAVVNPALLFRDFLVVLDYYHRRFELVRYGAGGEDYAARRTRLRKISTPFHFDVNGVWPILPASLDGSRVLPFVVDTGASDLLVARETAAALRVDPQGFVAAAGGHARERLRAILLDGPLSDESGIAANGILGFPFFRGMRVVFDYRAMILTLES